MRRRLLPRGVEVAGQLAEPSGNYDYVVVSDSALHIQHEGLVQASEYLLRDAL